MPDSDFRQPWVWRKIWMMTGGYMNNDESMAWLEGPRGTVAPQEPAVNADPILDKLPSARKSH